MATIRAIMKGNYTTLPKDEDEFYWCISWICLPLNGSGAYFDLETETLVSTGDTAAVVAGKIIDSVVAGILQRQPADIIPRTNVYLLDFIRGS